MTKEDVARKLTSRKFWSAVITFVVLIIKAFGYSESVASETAAIIMAGATIIAYLIAEGFTDASHEEVYIEELTEDELDTEEPKE